MQPTIGETRLGLHKGPRAASERSQIESLPSEQAEQTAIALDAQADVIHIHRRLMLVARHITASH